MNIVDACVFVVAIIFSIAFFKDGLISVLKSLGSFLLSSYIAAICLEPCVVIIQNWGWRENVFTPLVFFPLLIIIFWGIFMSCLIYVPVVWENKISSLLSIPFSVIYALSVCAVLILIIPQLIGFQAIKTVNNSFLSRNLDKWDFYSKNKKKFLKSIDQEIAKAIIVPKEDNETITLNIGDRQGSISQKLADEVFALTNESRLKKGLYPLERDKLLDAVAVSYADEIIRTKKFSHINLQGRTPDQRALELGMKFNYMGENLAMAPTVLAAHDGLMQSQSHKENIESPVFKRVGIGVLQLGTSGIIIVEEFSN